MDCLCDQLFANTTLASDEDRAVAGADPRDVVVDHLHRFRVTDDIRWAVAALELIVETSVFLQAARDAPFGARDVARPLEQSSLQRSEGDLNRLQVVDLNHKSGRR